MSFAARVATLHPIIVSALWLVPLASAAEPDLAPFVIFAWLPIWFIWIPCIYVTMRNATTPPPQKRFPLFAITIFALGIGGWIAGMVLRMSQPSDIITWPSPVEWVTSFSFGIGLFASFWVTADAFVKAETGKPWLADLDPVRDTGALLTFPIVGAWFLHPRIKRVLGQD